MIWPEEVGERKWAYTCKDRGPGNGPCKSDIGPQGGDKELAS